MSRNKRVQLFVRYVDIIDNLMEWRPQAEQQPLGTVGDSDVVGHSRAVARITRRSLGTLGDEDDPANPPKMSLGTLGDSKVSTSWKID